MTGSYHDLVFTFSLACEIVSHKVVDVLALESDELLGSRDTVAPEGRVGSNSNSVFHCDAREWSMKMSREKRKVSKEE